VAKEREPERDVVRELQEDARWSMWTNTFTRMRARPPGPMPGDPGVRTFMLAAVLVIGAALAAVGIVVFLFSLR
jgi:hypothetical protein